MISIVRAARAPGRILALAILALAVLLRLWDPASVQELRLHVFDAEQWLFPREPLPDSPVRIVEIDDKSLAKYGQWPWPRTLLARLVERIAAAQPSALGIDIIFAEQDRTSPAILARELPDLPGELSAALARLPSNDSRLAAAIGKVLTVLGVALTKKMPGSGPAGSSALPNFAEKLQSLKILSDAATASGAITVERDIDGISRRLPLAAMYGGNAMPGLAVAVLSVAATGASPPPRPRLGATGIDGVVTAFGFVPSDTSGAVWLHFAPRARSYSASDILDGALDPASLKDAIVLLAVTGLGTVDLQRTPLGAMYGIEFHAQLADSILSGELLLRPPLAFWVELASLLAAGLAIIWLVRYDKPLVAAGSAAGAVAALLGSELALFRFAGWLLDGAFPAAVTLAVFGAMLQGSLGASQTARRRLEAELQQQRERQARVEGELAAARTIQIGLLPHRIPAFPERGDIDIYARIEPARAIGGDLFDYVLLEADRLFFMVADVSGKGIPAALFMAMTKEVVRDAVARHGSALDRVLAEANNKIAAASADLAEDGGDMMFVTAFAGILDLASGEVVYASAGHDSPFIVRAGHELRQLATEGGPPLGAVEDFNFPIDRDHLDSGEVLLLYTDGVTEAQDRAGALYSAVRLAGLLEAIRADSAEDVVADAFEDVRRFAGDAEQADDITLLAIRRVTG